jgi:hypothetical protein
MQPTYTYTNGPLPPPPQGQQQQQQGHYELAPMPMGMPPTYAIDPAAQQQQHLRAYPASMVPPGFSAAPPQQQQQQFTQNRQQMPVAGGRWEPQQPQPQPQQYASMPGSYPVYANAAIAPQPMPSNSYAVGSPPSGQSQPGMLANTSSPSRDPMLADALRNATREELLDALLKVTQHHQQSPQQQTFPPQQQQASPQQPQQPATQHMVYMNGGGGFTDFQPMAYQHQYHVNAQVQMPPPMAVSIPASPSNASLPYGGTQRRHSLPLDMTGSAHLFPQQGAQQQQQQQHSTTPPSHYPQQSGTPPTMGMYPGHQTPQQQQQQQQQQYGVHMRMASAAGNSTSSSPSPIVPGAPFAASPAPVQNGAAASNAGPSAYSAPPAVHPPAVGPPPPPRHHVRDATPPPAPGDTEPGPRQLIVNYLPTDATDAELHGLFSAVGPVEAARVIYDKQSGLTKGFGFVYFYRHSDASAAIDRLTGHPLRNKRLKVSYANPQRPVQTMVQDGGLDHYPTPAPSPTTAVGMHFAPGVSPSPTMATSAGSPGMVRVHVPVPPPSSGHAASPSDLNVPLGAARERRQSTTSEYGGPLERAASFPADPMLPPAVGTAGGSSQHHEARRSSFCFEPTLNSNAAHSVGNTPAGLAGMDRRSSFGNSELFSASQRATVATTVHAQLPSAAASSANTCANPAAADARVVPTIHITLPPPPARRPMLPAGVQPASIVGSPAKPGPWGHRSGDSLHDLSDDDDDALLSSLVPGGAQGNGNGATAEPATGPAMALPQPPHAVMQRMTQESKDPTPTLLRRGTVPSLLETDPSAPGGDAPTLVKSVGHAPRFPVQDAPQSINTARHIGQQQH